MIKFSNNCLWMDLSQESPKEKNFTGWSVPWAICFLAHAACLHCLNSFVLQVGGALLHRCVLEISAPKRAPGSRSPPPLTASLHPIGSYVDPEERVALSWQELRFIDGQPHLRVKVWVIALTMALPLTSLGIRLLLTRSRVGQCAHTTTRAGSGLR